MAKDLLVVLDENRRLTEKVQQLRVELSEANEKLAVVKDEVRTAQRAAADAQAAAEKLRRLSDAADERLNQLQVEHAKTLDNQKKALDEKNEFKRVAAECQKNFTDLAAKHQALKDQLESKEPRGTSGLGYMRVPGERP